MKAFGLWATAGAWMATGCVESAPPLVAEGLRYQYVVSELRVPVNNVNARENSLDLDGNGVPDNQLGMVFGTLNGEGLGVGDTAREALKRGGLVMLAELQTLAFDDAIASGFTTYLGSDPMPNPCLDPTRLETCGQHLLGQGQFTIDDGSTSHEAVGPIIDGTFLETMSLLPVEIAIDAATPIRLDLRGARVRLSQISETHATGVLAGAITRTDLDTVVIPQAAAQMNRIITAECSQANGVAPCGCVSSSRARNLEQWFDEDHDCTVEVSELATNSLVQSLLAPDVIVHGQEMLSFGVGIELAAATFPSPSDAP